MQDRARSARMQNHRRSVSSTDLVERILDSNSKSQLKRILTCSNLSDYYSEGSNELSAKQAEAAWKTLEANLKIRQSQGDLAPAEASKIKAKISSLKMLVNRKAAQERRKEVENG